MTNGGTLAELDAQLDALTAAFDQERGIVMAAEETFVADPTDVSARASADEHRTSARDYAHEISLLRDERHRCVPQPRGAWE